MIFDLETNINHVGFAVHHNFSPSWDFFDLLASIRPRPFSRGNKPFFAIISKNGNSLQFGHDLSAVETGQSYLDIVLQYPRFNSATTFQPWKLRPEHAARSGTVY